MRERARERARDDAPPGRLALRAAALLVASVAVTILPPTSRSGEETEALRGRL
jgi:hypothetical protein